MGYTPPSVTLYTGMSAKYYCILFAIIFALHLIALFIMKSIVSNDFNEMNILDKILHCVESSSFPFCVNDWDFRNDGGPVEHYKRMKKTRFETMLNVMINCFFSCILLIPLVYLCKLLYYFFPFFPFR